MLKIKFHLNNKEIYTFENNENNVYLGIHIDSKYCLILKVKSGIKSMDFHI